MTVWRLWLIPIGVAFAAGSLWAHASRNPGMEDSVYLPPLQYEVVRRADRVTYFAHGRKVKACDPVAPFVARIYDADGKLLDTRAVRQSDGSVAASSVDGGVPKGDTFFANGLWFKPRAPRMADADYFYVVVRCDLTDDGEQLEIDARFGPFEMPPINGRKAFGGFKAARVVW